MNYLDIKINNKHFIQRSEFSKLIVINENGKKSIFDTVKDLPEDVKQKVQDAIKILNTPDRYFKYEKVSNTEIELTELDSEAISIDNIKHLYIPENISGYTVSSLNDLLKDANEIETLHLPETIEELYEYMCEGCESLKEIHIPNRITKLPYGCFLNCKDLERINLENIEQIDGEVFGNCYQLNNLNLNKLKRVENFAFCWCVNLKEVNAPNLIYIGNDSFSECKFLETIKFSDKLDHIGNGAFYRCYHLKDIKLPENLTSIGDYTFEDCDALKTIKFPSKLQSIGRKAFFYSGLEGTITLPETLLHINKEAFRGCQLSRIEMSKNTQHIDAFEYEQIFKIKTYDTFIEKAKRIFDKER